MMRHERWLLLHKTACILSFCMLWLLPGNNAAANDTVSALSNPLSGAVTSASPRLASPVERFSGEVLQYQVSFLWFDRLAAGRLTLQPGKIPGTFHAELQASTLGVASWLTGDRVQRYVSEMELGPDGRMRTLSHESWVIKGSGKNRREKGRRYDFNYQTRKVAVSRVGGGGAGETTTFAMEPQQQPNDFLTAFYNFRAGALGEIREGGRYTIPTFTRKGRADIEVYVFPLAERPEDRFFPAGGYLARVTLDPEVLDTAGGGVFVWFDERSRPARGVVENVLSLGNVRGILKD